MQLWLVSFAVLNLHNRITIPVHYIETFMINTRIHEQESKPTIKEYNS